MSNSNPEEKSQSVDPKQLGITEERIKRFKKAFEAKWLKEKIRKSK